MGMKHPQIRKNRKKRKKSARLIPIKQIFFINSFSIYLTMKMDTDRSSAAINIVGFVIFLVLYPILLLDVNSALSDSGMLFIVIYGIAMLIFWPIQIAYHVLLANATYNPTLQRIDRGSMLILIAAIFSPVIIAYIPEPVAMIMVVFFWILVVLGIVLLLAIEDLSRHLAPAVAFTMGIAGMIAILIRISALSVSSIMFFVLGSALLLIAGVVYLLKKPDPSPEVFGFHEVFHVLILIGTIFLHFLVSGSILFIS